MEATAGWGGEMERWAVGQGSWDGADDCGRSWGAEARASRVQSGGRGYNHLVVHEEVREHPAQLAVLEVAPHARDADLHARDAGQDWGWD